MSEESLLDTGIIRRGRWAPIVFPLPKPDGTFVDSERSREVLLRHACKGPRRAQLPARDEIAALIGHISYLCLCRHGRKYSIIAHSSAVVSPRA
jgi:hypothetical protein